MKNRFSSIERVISYIIITVFIVIYVSLFVLSSSDNSTIVAENGVIKSSQILANKVYSIDGQWLEVDSLNDKKSIKSYLLFLENNEQSKSIFYLGINKPLVIKTFTNLPHFLVDKNNSSDKYATYLQSYPIEKGEIGSYIVVRFYKNTDFKSVLSEFVKIGTCNKINKIHDISNLINISFLGSIAIFGIYFLLYYFIKRSEVKILIFAMFNIAMVFRLILIGYIPLIYYFDSISNNLADKLALLLVITSSYLFILFLLHTFKNARNKYVYKIHHIVFGIIIFIALFSNGSYNIISEVYLLSSALYALYIILKAVNRKQPGAIIVFYGFMILFMGIISDSIAFHTLTNIPFTTSICLVFFILYQAIYFALENVEQVDKVERLNKAMELINEKNIKFSEASSKFVPIEFLHYLKKKTISDIKLGDYQEFNMTVLFIDIRGFTKLSESMSPAENFTFLNSYLKVISPSISKFNGFIDKYIGDAIMALFPTSPSGAIDAAIDVKKSLLEYNIGRARAGYLPIKIGAGVHSGKVILGTIGNEARMETTVISDAVNVSSRLEHATKFYGESILISDDVYEQVKDEDKYIVREVDFVKLRGKSKKTTIYSVLNGDDRFNSLYLDEYKTALKEFQNNDFASSLVKFSKLVDKNGFDKVSRIYYDRARYADISGAPEDWGGFYDIV